MKLKSLAVITLLVLGCSAAFAQKGSADLCFDDSGLYCNYVHLEWNGWQLGGEENESKCFSNNAPIAGAKVASLAGSGAPISGLVYGYTDPLFVAQYPEETWFVLTQTVPSTRLHHYGWVGYLGFYGYEFIANYGYLYTCNLGSRPFSNQRTYTAAQEALNQYKTQK